MVTHLHIGLEQAPIKPGQTFLVVTDELAHLFQTNQVIELSYSVRQPQSLATYAPMP